MFEQKFEQLLSDYAEAVEVRSRFVGLVKDYFPEEPRKVNLLVTTYDMGIVKELQYVQSINQTFAYRFVKRLMDEYGISRANADWAVSVWCVCYGEKYLGKSCEIKLTKKKDAPVIKPAGSGGQQYNDLFQYRTAGIDYEVCGFTGNMKTVIFPEQYELHRVTAIADDAFEENDLTDAIMTNGYRRIGNQAFKGCRNLGQVVLSNSLQEIGDYAFAGCEQLKRISLPQTIRQIGGYAFAGTALTEFVIPSTVIWTGKGVLSNCRNLKKVTLPTNMEEIQDEMFCGCTMLGKIELHQGILRIGHQAFRDCDSMREIMIPDSVIEIDDTAFENIQENLIILCRQDSYAEQYAQRKHIKYQYV